MKRTTWTGLRTELDVSNAHPAYESARLAFELGAEVRALREARAWSPTELARIAGMTQSAMARFEGGATLPTVHALERIADAPHIKLTAQSAAP